MPTAPRPILSRCTASARFAVLAIALAVAVNPLLSGLARSLGRADLADRIEVASAQAAGCDVTGTWIGGPTSTYRWSLDEDASGHISGAASLVGGQPGDALLAISGERSGDNVTFSFLLNGTGISFSGTMPDCDTISGQLNIGFSFSIARESTTYCGDGNQDPGEECDDGNFVNGDACTVACTLPACGNRIVEPGEQCDDGNLVQVDGCSNDCRLNNCGNGVLEPGEVCDDANQVNGDGCSRACQPNVCGNGVVESGEQCDHGLPPADGDGDQCSHLCQFEGCDVTGSWRDDFTGGFWNLREDGDGTLHGDLLSSLTQPAGAFTVASGSRNGSAVALLLAAGNGSLAFTGSMTSCNAISLTFSGIALSLTRLSTSYCGDGVLDAGEACDDGNFVNGDACTIACTPARCGDQIVGPGEQCDDGNLIPADGCSNDCQINHCGDGSNPPEPGEECDDGNLIDGDGCSASCRRNICGNGIVEPGEQCDDGQTPPQNGDGCSDLCQFEGCPMTGVWTLDGIAGGPSVARFVEGLGGAVTGSMSSNTAATPSFAVTGNRIANSTSLTLLTLPAKQPIATIAATSASCGDFTGSLTVGTTPFGTVNLHRISTGDCGDGVKDGGEQCDDGNTAGNDDCDFACRLPHCGNGTINPGETCDDGNANPNDACKNDCTPNVCGDAVLAVGTEQCDDGNANPNDSCKNDCTLNVCGDGVLLDGIEQCDDHNLDPSDGCDATCNAEKIQVAALPASGGTVSTDSEGDGATPANPVEISVVVPPLPTSAIVALAATTPTSPTTGYQTLGKQINITAPSTSPSNPLRFVFELDASTIPAGQDETTIVVFRNGTPVPDCLGAVQASPFDPCVTARARLGNDNVRLTVLSSHASEWSLAAKLPPPTKAQSVCRAEIRGRVTTLFGKRRDALARCEDLVRLGKTTAPCPDAAAAAKIVKAEAQLDVAKLAKKCPAGVVPTLGLRGGCAAAATPADLRTCLVAAVEAASDAAIAAEYAKPDVAVADRALRSCQSAIATGAGKTFAFHRLKLFASCQKNQDAAKVDACLDPRSAGGVLGAAAKLASGVARSCSDALVSGLGQLGGACSSATTAAGAAKCEESAHVSATDALIRILP